MPKQIDRFVLFRAYLLRRQGLSLRDIVDKVSEDFPERDIPDPSTLSRKFRQFEEGRLDNEIAEDLPFAWSEHRQLSWEDSRALLRLGRIYRSRGYEDSEFEGLYFSNRMARWSLSVARATCQPGSIDQKWFAETGARFLDLPFKDQPGVSGMSAGAPPDYHPLAFDIYVIASEYTKREMDSDLMKMERSLADLDEWMLFQPWRGPAAAEAYREERENSRMSSPSSGFSLLGLTTAESMKSPSTSNSRFGVDHWSPGSLNKVLLSARIFSSTVKWTGQEVKTATEDPIFGHQLEKEDKEIGRPPGFSGLLLILHSSKTFLFLGETILPTQYLNLNVFVQRVADGADPLNLKETAPWYISYAVDGFVAEGLLND